MDWGTLGGWYADFPDAGERMNIDLKLVKGTLVFATNIPAADSCTVGGKAWFNYVDYLTGLTVSGASMASTQIPDSLVVGITVVKLQGGAYKGIATKSNYQQQTFDVPICSGSSCGTLTASPFVNQRSLWREFEVY